MGCVFCDGRFSSIHNNSGWLTPDPIAPLMACSTIDGGKCPLVIMSIFRDDPVSYALEMNNDVNFQIRIYKDAQGNELQKPEKYGVPDWVYSDKIAIAFFRKLKKEYSEHLLEIMSGKTDTSLLNSYEFGSVTHMILQGEEIVAIDYNPGSNRLPVSYDRLSAKIADLFSNPGCGPMTILPDWGFGTFNKTQKTDLHELNNFLKSVPFSVRCSDIGHYTPDGGISNAIFHWRDYEEEEWHQRQNSLSSQYAKWLQKQNTRRINQHSESFCLAPTSKICYIQIGGRIRKRIVSIMDQFFRKVNSLDNKEDQLLEMIENTSNVFFGGRVKRNFDRWGS